MVYALDALFGLPRKKQQDQVLDQPYLESCSFVSKNQFMNLFLQKQVMIRTFFK